MKAALIVRWTARLLNLGLTALFVVLLIGEGPPPVLPLSWPSLSFLLLFLWLLGLLLAWRFEVAGPALAFAGIAGFYLNDFFLSGFQRWPGGWVFPLMLITPLLYFAAVILDRRRGEPRKSIHRQPREAKE